MLVAMKYPMSGQRALVQALATLMREARPLGFGLSRAECEISHDGTPPPLAGDWFWGVYGGGGSDSKIDSSVDFTTQPTVQVMLSARVGPIPYDRLGPDFVYGDQGMMDRLEFFCAWLARHQYDFMNLANEFLNGSHEPVNGFIEPGFTLSIQRVRVVGANHWQSAASTEKLKTPLAPAGIVGEVQIRDFKRIQYLEAVG